MGTIAGFTLRASLYWPHRFRMESAGAAGSRVADREGRSRSAPLFAAIGDRG